MASVECHVAGRRWKCRRDERTLPRPGLSSVADHGWRSTMTSAPAYTPARKNVKAWQAHNRRRWAELFERDHFPPNERIAFVCECPNGECFKSVMLTAMEFEAAHLCHKWLVVVPGHMAPETDADMIVHDCRFWVVSGVP
jgi:hypothetical protein